MTELSPAAQAVLNAVTEICPAPADEIAAAALRAAANQVGQVPVDPGIGTTQWRKGFSEGVRLVYRELLSLADELDHPSS